jgi:hypothetical protein
MSLRARPVWSRMTSSRFKLSSQTDISAEVKSYINFHPRLILTTTGSEFDALVARMSSEEACSARGSLDPDHKDLWTSLKGICQAL